jgi:two-component system, NarL family, sensor histidine kinase UhpB
MTKRIQRCIRYLWTQCNTKPLFLLIVFLFLIYDPLQGQTKSLTILPELLIKAKTKKDKIDVLNDYADTLCLYRNDTGRVLAEQALLLSTAEKYSKGLGEANYSMGLVYFRRDNDSAVYFFKQSWNYYQKEYPGFEKYILSVNNLTRTYNEMLIYDSALKYAKLTIRIVNNNKENEKLRQRWFMYSYGAIGNTFSGMNKYDSALTYYIKALKYAENLKFNKMIEYYMKAIANNHSQAGNYEMAINYLEKGIQYIENDNRARVIALATLAGFYSKVKNYVAADLLADSSLKLSARVGIGNSVGENYITLGDSKMAQQRYHSALTLYLTGIAKGQQFFSSQFTMSTLYRKAGEAYETIDSLYQAEKMYKKALEVGNGNSQLEGNISLAMSKLKNKGGDFQSAYKYLLKYNEFKDSALSRESRMAVIDLNTQYETEKKEQQLLLLGKENELQRLKLIKQQQQVTVAELAKQQQLLQLANLRLEALKNEQLLQIQELDIENFQMKQKEQQALITSSNSKLDLEKKEKEFSLNKVKAQRKWLWALAGGMLAGVFIFGLLFNRYKLIKKIQEQKALVGQRQNISRNLHDELGATLSGIAMYSHLIKGNLAQKKLDAAELSADIIQDSATEMVTKLNDIIWLVNPQKESLKDLVAKLKEYALNMCAAKNISPSIELFDQVVECKPPIETRKNIYLFCKEAINNTCKYSNATKLLVSFQLQKNILTIIIKDNGIGFDINNVQRGNGLDNMQTRADDMGANFSIQSAPQQGCTITLEQKITRQGIV